MRRPQFIAEQARNARGPVGRLVAAIMARETWSQNVRAMDALGIGPGDEVLDVGCGHGRSLAALAARTPGGRAVGVDPSELMVRIARRRNRRLVASGQVEVRVGGAQALPVADAAFDAALCVHVVYFWDDLARPFREIARALKPGGRLALVFRSTADAAALRSFPPEVYRFRPAETVAAALEAAGLTVEHRDAAGEPVLLVARKPAA